MQTIARHAITVDGLSKTYDGFAAVDDVSFVCPPGSVTGFLGPNGAGKTTTLRIIAGLTSATRGLTSIFGQQYRDIPNPGAQVGVLLDASAQHVGRTGHEVLALGALAMGLPMTRVDEMLELVSLSRKEAGRRVRDYSLGMRQRLGIAHALLGNPSVLVLDEPANGLDPAGIRWMRGLLRDFADRGGAVLLSSHLLHEVEAVADGLVVIGNGRIVAQGTTEELLRAEGTVVRATRHAALFSALERAGIATEPSGDGGLIAAAPAGEIGEVVAAAGVALRELRSADGTALEAMFLRLTTDEQREGPVREGVGV